MKNFLLKFIKQKNINLNTNLKFENLKKKHEIKKIFNIFSNDLNNCQIRFIGGCVRKALSNENVDDIDLVESNEAFAAQACAVNKQLGLDPAKVNVNGLSLIHI